MGCETPWRAARDPLIKRINSLMARFNSLLGRNKFPVPMRREFGPKPLNFWLYFGLITGLGRSDVQIPCIFHLGSRDEFAPDCLLQR